MNFIFECSTRYLSGERSERVRYRFEHSEIKFLSMHPWASSILYVLVIPHSGGHSSTSFRCLFPDREKALETRSESYFKIIYQVKEYRESGGSLVVLLRLLLSFCFDWEDLSNISIRYLSTILSKISSSVLVFDIVLNESFMLGVRESYKLQDSRTYLHQGGELLSFSDPWTAFRFLPLDSVELKLN